MSTTLQLRRVSKTLLEQGGFDERSARAFIFKYNSPETRKAYRRALNEFFEFARWTPQSEITKEHVIAYREHLRERGRRDRTIAQRLAGLRSYFDYLVADGTLERNPASTKLVQPPRISRTPAGRALSKKEALNQMVAPDRRTPDGARDYALMLVMFRVGLRLSEVCALRRSSIRPHSSGWKLVCRIKGGEENEWPLPEDVKVAIDDYLRLDEARRSVLGITGPNAWLFTPHKNHRTLEYNKPLSQRMVQKIVGKWANYSGAGHVTPHDLRRTCLTEMLKIYPAQAVQKVSKHKDLNTLMGYNHDRENLEDNPVNSFSYE